MPHCTIHVSVLCFQNLLQECNIPSIVVSHHRCYLTMIISLFCILICSFTRVIWLCKMVSCSASFLACTSNHFKCCRLIYWITIRPHFIVNIPLHSLQLDHGIFQSFQSTFFPHCSQGLVYFRRDIVHYSLNNHEGIMCIIYRLLYHNNMTDVVLAHPVLASLERRLGNHFFAMALQIISH